MQAPAGAIGDPLDAIDTPALIVDLDAFDRNIAKMAALAAQAGVKVRPHAKTHKCPAIALKQIAAGAVGQCVQKVGEAEALVAGGVTDILVSNEVVGEPKLHRLAALAREATIALCFDSAGQVDIASRIAGEFGVELGALVELDVGMARCGVATPAEARDLARRIADAPNLTFRGLQAYQGRAQHFATYGERRDAIAVAVGQVRECLDLLSAAGLESEIVGGGGTGTFRMEAASGVYNEIQPGSYVFMDTEYARILDERGEGYHEFEHSLFVLSSVMSAPVRERAVLDAGLKSYSTEKGLPWVAGRAGLTVTGVSDEHAVLDVAADAASLKIGDRVMLVPPHCDPAVNIHDHYIGIRNGIVTEILPITARGASR